MSKVWITGGFGFVGQHLCRALQDRGEQVLVIERPGRTAPAGCLGEALHLDLTRAGDVADALAQTRPRAILHLAAQSSAGRSFEIPMETLENNLGVTVGLLEGMRAAKAHGPPMLSVGSCEEYGPPESETAIAETQTLRPSSPYAVSKVAQTLLCLQYHRAYQLPIVCVRAFTHTGPGQSSRFVFPSFAAQVAQIESQGAPGVLNVGNLDAVRDVSDVRDVVRAYLELIETAPAGTLVNVCSGRGLRIKDGLRLLLSQAKVPIEVQVDPDRLRPLDVPTLVGDVTRLKSILGWVPSTPVEETLGSLLHEARAAVTEGTSPRS